MSRAASTSAATSSHVRQEQPRSSVAASSHRRLEQPRSSLAGAAVLRRLEQPRASVAASLPQRLEQPRSSIAAASTPRRLEQPCSSVAAAASPQPPRVLFPEEQFWAVCRDMGKPRATAGSPWKLLTDSTGVSVYRLLDEKSGLYEYKVFGVIHGCPPDRCAEVYMDLRYRPKWDRYVKEVCEKIVDGRSAIYWEVKFPFPMTNRDYVFTRERRDLEVDGRKIYVILAKSVVTSKFPEKPGLIRVNHYKQNVAIESDGRNGSKIYMFYFENPGGKVPSWAVNWAAKTGVPNFVKDMQKACLGYQRRRSTAHQM